MSRVETVRRGIDVVGVVLVCVALVFPIVWGVGLSLKTRVDGLAVPPKVLFTPTTSNYEEAFLESNYGRTIGNSVTIATCSAVLAMMLGVPAAYGFSRFRSVQTVRMFLALLSVRMAPATVIALPLFLFFARLGLLTTLLPIIVVHAAIAVPIAAWILKGYFDEVDPAIDEASYLDGTSQIGTLVSQIIPLCLPGMLMSFVFCFVISWNELFLALILTAFDNRPFTVAVPALVTPHGTYWGQVTAVCTVALLPGVLFAFVARRLFWSRHG